MRAEATIDPRKREEADPGSGRGRDDVDDEVSRLAFEPAVGEGARPRVADRPSLPDATGGIVDRGVLPTPWRSGPPNEEDERRLVGIDEQRPSALDVATEDSRGEALGDVALRSCGRRLHRRSAAPGCRERHEERGTEKRTAPGHVPATPPVDAASHT